jgi:hypothetical protein
MYQGLRLPFAISADVEVAKLSGVDCNCRGALSWSSTGLISAIFKYERFVAAKPARWWNFQGVARLRLADTWAGVRK